MRIFIILFFISISCGSSLNKKNTFTISKVEDLQKLFDLPFASLQKEVTIRLNNTDLHIKDTLLEEEDVQWAGLNFYYNDTCVFIAENNWEQKDSVKRITVCSSLLKTSSSIGIGDTFKSIKSLINFNSWSDFPDGYIMFKDRENPGLIYTMDVNDSSSLLNEALSKNTFPDTVKVASILLQ